MLSIIFPAFNEAESLKRYPAEVIPVFDALGCDYEVIIVDDGSQDETAAVASALGPRVRLVRHERNRGLGAALCTGLAAAKGELVVTLDSDLTFSPHLVKILLERHAHGDVDVVSGSPKLAGFAPEIPGWRIFVSKSASFVYSVILGQKITAVSPILRLYRRSDLAALPLKATGFDINAEILFLLVQRGKRIAEVPAPLTQRLHGESKLDYSREMRRHVRLIGRMLAWRMGSSKRLGREPAA
ncbi:MAG TPA: glycosyltransferase family 2 protein [Anaeromyxobacteraceae bacterium]|jgi:dolichol-phosphate mannosyltransferase|nr:glycosyltransferase family 2 protein [Anaeromyxobacteraceae bacterium]